MDFIFLKLWLKFYIVTTIFCTVTGDMSVDVAFSLLNDRLDNLKSELKTSVASINNRIDTLEMTYDSILEYNPIEQADQFSSDERDLSNQMATTRREHNVMHALKAEKVFIRKSLDTFERKFAVFQTSVTDNVNAMNETIEQLKLQSGEKLKEFVSEQNKFKNQMTSKLNQAVEEINAQVRESLQNATIEQELYFNTMESAIHNVNTTAMSTSKRIKQELDTEIKNQVISVIKDNKVIIRGGVVLGPPGSYYYDEKNKFNIPKSGIYLMHLSATNTKDTFELHAGRKTFTGGSQTQVMFLKKDEKVYVDMLHLVDKKGFSYVHLTIVLLS